MGFFFCFVSNRIALTRCCLRLCSAFIGKWEKAIHQYGDRHAYKAVNNPIKGIQV
nr:MAG TPA: hypothetical protein [Caudoviricetes sp.]